MLHQGTNKQLSLVRTDTVLITSWFSVLWTWVTPLIIIDSLSLRLGKLFYCKEYSLRKPVIRMTNDRIRVLVYTQPILLNIIGNGNYSGSFCLAPQWKSNWLLRNFFILFFAAQFFEFSFNPRCKIKWPPGHLTGYL